MFNPDTSVLKEADAVSTKAEELIQNAYNEWLEMHTYGVMELSQMTRHKELLEFIIKLEQFHKKVWTADPVMALECEDVITQKHIFNIL